MNDNMESRWREREEALLREIEASVAYYKNRATWSNLLHRIISIIVLIGSVVAPVAVVSSSGAGSVPGAGLAVFGVGQQAIAQTAVAVTVVLAFCEGLRRLFQFDQRWMTCVLAREELRRMRDQYLDDQVPNPVGTDAWMKRFYQLRQQTHEVLSQEERGFFERMSGPSKVEQQKR